MSAPKTLEQVPGLPDETTLRRLLALLGNPQNGGADAAV